MPEIFGAALMGGGSGPAFAAISVTYPAGATCTCALGSKTYTAPDTSGQALFIVPTAGEWLVTAKQGSNEKSVTVSVNENKAYTIALNFSLYLLEAGVDNTAVTGGWTGTKWGHNFTYVAPSISFADGVMTVKASGDGTGASGMSTRNPINISKYNTLYIKGKLSWSSWGVPGDGGGAEAVLVCSTNVNAAENMASLGWTQGASGSKEVEVSLDVSNINTSQYIGCRIQWYLNGPVVLTIAATDIWLK